MPYIRVTVRECSRIYVSKQAGKGNSATFWIKGMISQQKVPVFYYPRKPQKGAIFP
jgi:hypothetical protein